MFGKRGKIDKIKKIRKVYGSDKSIGPVRLIVTYKGGNIKEYGLIIKMPAPYLIEIDEQNKVTGYRVGKEGDKR